MIVFYRKKWWESQGKLKIRGDELIQFIPIMVKQNIFWMTLNVKVPKVNKRGKGVMKNRGG